MNPYAYPQAQLQQQQPQQYQYQAQYTQQQPYYYVQPSQAQLFQTPQQYPQYGAVAYQTPQTAASVGQYTVQGYTQVAGAQQYVAASAPGQNFYPAAVQVNQGHDQATAQKDAPIASEERPPPLPPEQVDSSTPAPPPLPPEPAPNSLSVEQKISEAQKQYQEKYAEWQRQYAQWQAQHQNHPDQRQYQEWQQQMKHWTQHNQTLMQIKGGDEQQQPVQQQPVQQQPIKQQPIKQQPIQQQPIQQQPIHQQPIQQQQIQQQPIQQQPIQQQPIQQQPIQQQPIQQQAAVGSVSAPAQGHTVVKQQQQYQQYQQQSQHQQQAPQHQQQQPQHQQQSQHQQQQQPQQQQLYSQQTPSNQHQQFVHNQRQPVQAQWSQGNSSQNTPGHYNQQQNPNHFNQRQSQQQQWQSQYYDKNKTSNWTQNQNNRNRQSSQNYNQGPLPQKIPGLMDVQPVRPQNDSKIQHKNEFTSEESHLPKWMQSSKATARPSELEQSSSWTHKSAAAENKHVPKWLQSQNSSSNQQQHQDDNGMPRWLKEKLEKTEWDVKQEAAKKALQATEVLKKHIPKWLQEGSSKSDQAKTVTPGKQMPNWLSNNKPFPVGNQGEDHQTKVQIPKWLQAKIPAAGRNTTGQINSGERSTKTGSKWDKVERNTSSTMIGVSADNLDPLKELEFLRKQQEQLQQLEKLEKQLKQTSPALSTMGKSESTTTTSSSSVVTSNQVEKAANNPWLQYSLSGQANDKSSAADHNKGTAVRNSKAKGKKQACKFFPNCRFGIGCKFQHPPCKNVLRCENDSCIFDHSEDSSNEQNAEESQHSGDFPHESEMQSQGIVSLTSKGDQIPGIGDGEYPIKPAQTLDKTKTDGDSNDKDNYQGSKYPQSQGDYMDVESDQYQGEKQPQVSAEGEQSVPTASRQNETEHFQQSEHPEHVWGPRGDPERPPYFGERHPKDALPWDKEKPHQDLDRPPPPPGDRFLGWDREHPPTNRDRRPPPPREGQYGDEDLHRRDWRPPFDRHNSGPRPPSPRGERDFDPFRHDRDRPPPFPPGDRDKGPWLDQPGGRPPFPREEWDRKPPFPRDRPPFPVDERHPQEQYGRRSPLLGRHTWEERPPFRDVKEGGPPVPGTEAGHRPHNIGAIDTYSKQDEQGKEGHQIPREPTDKEPPEMEGGERPPYPRDEQPRPPSPRQDWDRPPFPQDHWNRPPFPRDEWDRSPFPRDDRDIPPFPRDEWDRPPFPRDEREWPPHAGEERDRRPFPRDERDFPFPPRGGRDHWPPPVRDERERWPPPLPPGERDEFRWFSREHGPPGRSMSPRGRDGHRSRHPFDEDERRRRMSPPPWPPLEHFRRGRSPPREELRGRPPPPEEFDRFGRPIPPPWDRERRDWIRPPEEERFRDLPHPADRWRRSPSPHRELLERFPPDHPKEWERDGRRGPDDRFYDERPPPDRLPPIDDHYRDRPRYPEDRPPHDPAAYPPHPHDSRHPTEAPRLEKKPETVPVESILDPPGRDSRPDRIVIILRGPPGSGKTHVARLIKDKEVNNGAHAPRILALDDYFLMEVEKVEQDPETGKKVKKKVTEYVFEEEMEEAYQASLFKSFSKTLEDGFFPVVIVDAIHDKVEHFEKYWSHAKQKGFEVYVAELMADAHACAKRNSHNRTFEDINKMVAAWEETPVHHLRLDVRSLLQDAVITEVEMEAADESAVEASSEEMEKQQEPVEEVESEIQVPSRSKWEEMEPAEDKLNKLDGIRLMKGKRKREESPPMHFSDDDDPYDEREEDMRIGKKRVRWADLEEKKELEHRRRIGFCIGTDWSLLTDPHAEIPRM